MSDSKRKWVQSTSSSDCDSSVNKTPVTSKYFETNKSDKAKKQQKGKKAKVSEGASASENLTSELSVGEMADRGSKKSIEQRLEEICEKMANILTKDDRSFIREIMCDTLEEMKDKLFASVVKRLDVVEGDMHDLAVRMDGAGKEVERCVAEQKVLREENKRLRVEMDRQRNMNNERLNDLEQYQRRNNLRISGLPDKDGETAEDTLKSVVTLMEDKLNLTVDEEDIDIAHRLGKYNGSKSRQVIVRFVHRYTKQKVLRNAKLLKGSRMYIMEDLTRLNQEVLASLRLKSPEFISRAWSYEGKLFAKSKNDIVKRITFSEYQNWLSKPWPVSR